MPPFSLQGGHGAVTVCSIAKHSWKGFSATSEMPCSLRNSSWLHLVQLLYKKPWSYCTRSQFTHFTRPLDPYTRRDSSCILLFWWCQIWSWLFLPLKGPHDRWLQIEMILLNCSYFGHHMRRLTGKVEGSRRKRPNQEIQKRKPTSLFNKLSTWLLRAGLLKEHYFTRLPYVGSNLIAH